MSLIGTPKRREALKEIENMTSMCGALSWSEALERLTAVNDRARAALAAREEPQGDDKIGETWTPTIGEALTDLLAWVQENTSNYSDESRDNAVRDAIEALEARSPSSATWKVTRIRSVLERDNLPSNVAERLAHSIVAALSTREGTERPEESVEAGEKKPNTTIHFEHMNSEGRTVRCTEREARDLARRKPHYCPRRIVSSSYVVRDTEQERGS